MRYVVKCRTSAWAVFPETVHEIEAETVEGAKAKARLESEAEARGMLRGGVQCMDFEGDCNVEVAL